MNEILNKTGNNKMCPIAIIMRDGKMLTGYRHYTEDKWKKISVWTVPGGRCENGEIIQDALRREVLEEVGINEFEIVDFIGEVPGAKDGDIVQIFFCTTKQDFKLMEPEKFSEWRWISIDEYKNNKEYRGFNSRARNIIVDYLNSL